MAEARHVLCALCMPSNGLWINSGKQIIITKMIYPTK